MAPPPGSSWCHGPDPTGRWWWRNCGWPSVSIKKKHHLTPASPTHLQLTSKIFYASVTSNSTVRIQDKNNTSFSTGQSDWLILIHWKKRRRVNNTSPKLVAPYTTAHQLSKGAATLKPSVVLSICCLEFQSLGKETIHYAQPDLCVSALTHNLTRWACCFWDRPKQHEHDGSVNSHKPEFILLFFVSLWAFHSMNCLFFCVIKPTITSTSSQCQQNVLVLACPTSSPFHHLFAAMTHFCHHFITSLQQGPTSITISSPLCSHDPLPSPFHHLFAATTHLHHHFITYLQPRPTSITISSPLCSHDPLRSPFHHLSAAMTHFHHHFIASLQPDFSSYWFTVMLSRWEVTPPNICTKGK